MINIFKKLVLSFVLVLVFIASGCTQADNSNPVEETQQNNDVLQIKVVDSKEEIDKEIEISDGAILMEILKEHFTVDEKDGFINGVGKISVDEKNKEFLAIYINGETAMKGANDLEVMNGDLVELIVETWE